MRRSGNLGRAHPMSGFTISELLITMGLSAVVAVAMLAASQMQVVVDQNERHTSQLLDNARAVTSELRRSVDQASIAFLSGVATNAVPPGNPVEIGPLQVQNSVEGTPSGDGPDAISVVRNDDTQISVLMQDADHFTAPIPDAEQYALPFLIIPASAEGEAALFLTGPDSVAGTLIGYHRTRAAYGNPSRVTVDLEGDFFISNRKEDRKRGHHPKDWS